MTPVNDPGAAQRRVLADYNMSKGIPPQTLRVHLTLKAKKGGRDRGEREEDKIITTPLHHCAKRVELLSNKCAVCQCVIRQFNLVQFTASLKTKAMMKITQVRKYLDSDRLG